MKILLIRWLFILLFIPVLLPAQGFRKINNEAFTLGEKLKFKVYYDAMLTGRVTAGIATLEIKKDYRKIGDRLTYHIEGTGKSRGAFNLFYKVNDRFETYLDKESIIPWLFVRRTREGDYYKDDDVTFNHYRNLAISRTATKPVPENVQDIISAIYYARTLDISDVKYGDELQVPFFLDDSVYSSRIVYLGKEMIKTSAGSFRCLKFKPKVVTGNVFKEQYPMTLWVTDDKNRIPVLGESAVIVGSIKMELIDYSGLANPLTSKLD